MKRKCFVIMPIGGRDDGSFDRNQEIYQELIQPAVTAANPDFVCLRADKDISGSIIKEIMNDISDADVVIADLTGSNPNVFYELGVRHALAGRSVMIAQDIAKVPFDLRPYRVLEYDPTLRGAAIFRDRLRHYLADVIQRPDIPDNPVLDYLAGRRREDIRAQLANANETIRNLRLQLSRYSHLWPMPTSLPRESPDNCLLDISAFRTTHNEKIIVIDDDPGGLHAVSNVPFFLSLEDDSIAEALQSRDDLVFLVTDSRSHKEVDAIAINHRIGKILGSLAARSSCGKITIISRGDSTLRGHYPKESDALRTAFEISSGQKFHCELFCPAYIEAGRITLAGIHWQREEQNLRPVGLTDYAHDPTFGFQESQMGDWMKSKLVCSDDKEFELITLDEIRIGGHKAVADRLLRNSRYTRYVCDAITDHDLDVIALATCKVEDAEKRVFFRSAPSFIRARAGRTTVSAKPSNIQLKIPVPAKPGLVVVGSITDISRKQREALEVLDGIDSIELDAKQLYTPFVKSRQLGTIVRRGEVSLRGGRDVLIYTSEYHQDAREHPLDARGRVLFALAEVTKPLVHDVGFVIAKGSDTGYLLLKECLHINNSRFEGVVMTGVGYCVLNTEEHEQGLPFFLHHGNSGDEDNLANLVRWIRGEAVQ